MFDGHAPVWFLVIVGVTFAACPDVFVHSITVAVMSETFIASVEVTLNNILGSVKLLPLVGVTVIDANEYDNIVLNNRTAIIARVFFLIHYTFYYNPLLRLYMFKKAYDGK